MQIIYIITPHEEAIHLKVVSFPYTAVCRSYDMKYKNEQLHHAKIVNDAMTQLVFLSVSIVML